MSNDTNHHGEPVALPERIPVPFDWYAQQRAEGWNACLDEIAKLGPLYSRQVQGYSHEVVQSLQPKIDSLRAQLTEAQALLREAACHATRMEPMSASCLNRIDTHLDASAATGRKS